MHSSTTTNIEIVPPILKKHTKRYDEREWTNRSEVNGQERMSMSHQNSVVEWWFTSTLCSDTTKIVQLLSVSLIQTNMCSIANFCRNTLFRQIRSLDLSNHPTFVIRHRTWLHGRSQATKFCQMPLFRQIYSLPLSNHSTFVIRHRTWLHDRSQATKSQN